METNRKSIFGVVLIILGIYFLLENLDIIDIQLPYYFFTWQMLLIGLGFINLLTGNRKAALVLFSIGVFFFLPEFFDFKIRDYWPLLLIFIGVSFFLRNMNNSRATMYDAANSFDDLAIFGSNEKNIISTQFQGGKTSTIFGSTKLDFREAEFGSNEAIVTVFTMFGSTELFVPRDWEVLSEVTPILASFEEKRGSVNNHGNKKLIIKGLATFGSIEVKS